MNYQAAWSVAVLVKTGVSVGTAGASGRCRRAMALREYFVNFTYFESAYSIAQ